MRERAEGTSTSRIRDGDNHLPGDLGHGTAPVTSAAADKVTHIPVVSLERIGLAGTQPR